MNPPPLGSIVAHRDWTLPEHQRKHYRARTGTLKSTRTGQDGRTIIATVAMHDGSTLETLLANIKTP